MARYPGADGAQQIRDGYQVRWSRAPDQKARNFGDMFHRAPGFDALDLICHDVARASLVLYDKAQHKKDPEKAKKISDHALLALLDDPCPGHKELDGYILRYMTAAYLDMTGDFFWIIERNAKGYPAALYPCLPTWMVQTWSVSFPYYRILPQGVTSAREIVVDGEDVIWFKNPNMTDPFGRGKGRSEAIGDELEADEYAAKYQKNLFYNDAQPPMIVSLPDADATVTENLKETWIQRVAGWINARKPMFMNTTVEVKKLTDTVREMDMVESRKALRDIFNQHFALPPEMRGIIENSNRSTIDSADYLYKKNVLARHVDRFLGILNRQLVPQFDGRLILHCADLVPEDKKEKEERALKAFQAGILTENEYRRVCGWPEMPDGNVRLRAAKLVVVPAGEGDKPVEPPPAPPAPPPIKGKGFSPERKAAHWKAFDKKAADVERAFEAAVKKLSAKQGAMFKAQFDASLSKGMSAPEALDASISFVFGSKMDIETFNTFAPHWTEGYKAGVTLAANTISRQPNWELVNPLMQEWVRENGLKKAKEINGTTQEYLAKLRKPIAEQIEKGGSIDDITGMLAGEFDKLSGSRAQLIARTETLGSVNFGQFATYQLEGVKRKEWISTPDGDTRESHRQKPVGVGGEVVDMDKPFSNGLMYPGDPDGGASEVVNCRCSLIAAIEE